MIGARITTMRASGTSSARAAALIGRNIPSPITGRALPSSHSPSGRVTRGRRPTRSGAIPATPASSAAWSSQCVSWPRWVLREQGCPTQRRLGAWGRVDLVGGSPDAAHNNFPQRRVQLTTDACYCSCSASGSFCSMARRAWPRIRLPTHARRSAPAARRTVVPARCRSQPGVQRHIGRGQYPTIRSPSSYNRHPAGGSIQLLLSEFGQRVQTVAEQCTSARRSPGRRRQAVCRSRPARNRSTRLASHSARCSTSSVSGGMVQ
jgi:hypothetical protein